MMIRAPRLSCTTLPSESNPWSGWPVLGRFSLANRRISSPGAFSGSTFVLTTAEYRIPLGEVDRGISTIPVYLRQIGANLFVDYGGAFEKFDFDGLEFFDKGSIIYAKGLHTGIGSELWISASLFYGLTTLFRVGYAFGTSPGAIPGGQPYFIAAGAF